MEIDNWLRDLVNWYSYWAGSKTPERATYEAAVKRFGSLDRDAYDMAVDEAERGIDTVQLFNLLDIDEPLSAALAGETPPSANVEVRAWVEIMTPAGHTITRTIVTEVPWTMGKGELSALLWDLANQTATGYEMTVESVTVFGSLRFPTN